MSYNHTEKGLSKFQKLVPDYYYRFWPKGDPSDGAGLGNETESRHTMFRKFLLNNLSYWLTEYKVDGFRLDAMSLHDTETLQLAERTVHRINPNALLYGEAWNASPSALPEEERGYLTNIRRIRASENAVGGLAVFEYFVRDGLMGKNVKLDALGYALGAPDVANANWVAFGIDGCRQEGVEEWTVSDNMVLHYISCHDDYTIYDRLTFGYPDKDRDWVLRTNRMAASVVMLSRGTPFLLAGEEFFMALRSIAAVIVTVAFFAFQMYIALVKQFAPMLQSTIHLIFALTLVFIYFCFLHDREQMASPA